MLHKNALESNDEFHKNQQSSWVSETAENHTFYG
jgi:hypothetical protein